MSYEQLCGALGLLKQDDAELDWLAINDQIRDIARRLGIALYGSPGSEFVCTNINDPVFAEIETLHRQYRDMCLSRGLIRRGELFNRHDIANELSRY